MPSDIEHVEQAQHNLTFLQSFCSVYKFNDWATTVAFYSAIHIVEAVIYKKKRLLYLGKEIDIEHASDFPKALQKAELLPPKGLKRTPHAYREILIRQNFTDVQAAYKILNTECGNARYKYYICPDEVIKEKILPQLKVIIVWGESQLSSKFVFENEKHEGTSKIN